MDRSCVGEEKIACTGHIDLGRIGRLGEAEEQIGRALSACRGIGGLYCGFADGADLIFAEQAAAHGIPLIAVLPCPGEEFAKEHASPERYFALLSEAKEVLIARDGCDRYAGVTKTMLSCCGTLFALWDGVKLPLYDGAGNAINRGGTYDTVRLFLSAKKRVVVFGGGTSEVL